jgi:hypothetical protein
MPSNIENLQVKPSTHVEGSLVACPPALASHRQPLTRSVGGEKDVGSPMASSIITCDRSIKTLSLTPCDIDYGSTPQEVQVQKFGKGSSKDLNYAKTVTEKGACILSSSSEKLRPDMKPKELNTGSFAKLQEQTEGKPLDPRLNIPLFFPVTQWSSRYGIQFFTVAIPKVEVIAVPDKGPKAGFAEYTVLVKRGRQELARKYRYSQFAIFHRELLNSDIGFIIKRGKIYLPSKTWFRNLSAQFLEQRRKELENYLHSLLRYKYVPSEAIVQKFLGLNKFEVRDFWIDH